MHLVNLCGRERRMVQKTFAQMGKIPVRISRGCDALIDLDYMDSPPRHVGGCQIAQHDPWSAATTHCNNKSSARVYRQPRFFGDDRRRFLGDRLGRVQYFNVHLC
jgi:hypothetical protein